MILKITDTPNEIITTAVGFFKDYRRLFQDIEKFVILKEPFPESLVQSKLGVSMNAKEVRKRYYPYLCLFALYSLFYRLYYWYIVVIHRNMLLHNWFCELLTIYPSLDPYVKEKIATFLNVSEAKLEDTKVSIAAGRSKKKRFDNKEVIYFGNEDSDDDNDDVLDIGVNASPSTGCCALM